MQIELTHPTPSRLWLLKIPYVLDPLNFPTRADGSVHDDVRAAVRSGDASGCSAVTGGAAPRGARAPPSTPGAPPVPIATCAFGQSGPMVWAWLSGVWSAGEGHL